MFELTISSIILCYTEVAYLNTLSCMLLFNGISSNVETVVLCVHEGVYLSRWDNFFLPFGCYECPTH